MKTKHCISNDHLELIENLIPSGSTILELGSGEGTRDLVKNYTVYSVEQDKSFINRVPESNYIFAPLVGYEGSIGESQNNGLNYFEGGWYDPLLLKEDLPLKYDLLLIDGPGGILGGSRLGIMKFIHLFPLINSIPIIVDDAERKNEKLLLNNLSSYLNKSYTILKNNKSIAYFI